MRPSGASVLAIMALLGLTAPAGAAATRPAATRPAAPPATLPAPAVFIHWAFENASPLQWDVGEAGEVNVRLLYDYERESPNRAAGHFHFQVHGRPGAEVAVVLHNFDNVYNGRPGAVPVSKKSICFTSADGKAWDVVPAEFLEGNRLRVRVKLGEGGSLYLARLEPYRISDLQRLLDEIRGHSLVEVIDVGRTAEGRPLEVVRIGDPDAPRRALVRARSHPWEPGGNWVAQGLIRSLLSDDEVARACLKRYCLYVMPMANKDGVARGLTRFNAHGRDLNRGWDRPADARLAPENHALEQWIEGMIRGGRPIHLAIDLHNDESGQLHISRPPVKDLDRHLERVARLEGLLRRHTWFTEGSTRPAFRNAGTLGEGLLQRYGIDACILELNCNWAAGLKSYPSGRAWEAFGKGMREVLLNYFEATEAGTRG